ncbi:MAG: TraR/DksA C4-type zinc finger protein [Rhodobacteraceae bacterium]|jgi:RNA polymerase-binding transcription factor DksA|nr:TraR/DksA C4-type zinc finger protein [Paracoccaceae bacterium]
MATGQTDWRTILTGRLSELDNRLHGLDAELDSRRSADWAELATEREDDEVLERLGQSGEAEARQIRAALARLDAGSFGTCLRCSDPVGAARLAAVPHAALCAACAGGRA